MSKILVIAEHHDGKLNAATAKTVSAAAAISGASIDVLVLAWPPIRPPSPPKRRRSPASPRS